MFLSHDIRLVLSLGVLSACTQLAQGGLILNQGASLISYRHDVIEGGNIDRIKNQPSPAIQTPRTVTFVLPDVTLRGTADGISTLTSRARVGLAQNATSTTGTAVFKSNSLLSQSDPGNLSEAFSTLEIDFNLVWDVTAPGFGPPIIGSFSLPLLAVVGAGGVATAEIIDMHWMRFDGDATTDLRAPAATFLNFLPGTTLTTLTIPGAAFSPSSLITGDQFIFRGTVKLAVKNGDEPVTIHINPVPEPATAGLIGLSMMVLMARRRRYNINHRTR